MDDVTRLEAVAQQFIGRVHDDEPEANLRWLRAELGTDPAAPITETERLLFVLAAAVPAGRRWRELTEWARGPEEIATQQAMRRQALINTTARTSRRRAA